MPARSLVGSSTWAEALLMLSAFRAEKPRFEKINAGLSPLWIRCSLISSESTQTPYW